MIRYEFMLLGFALLGLGLLTYLVPSLLSAKDIGNAAFGAGVTLLITELYGIPERRHRAKLVSELEGIRKESVELGKELVAVGNESVNIAKESRASKSILLRQAYALGKSTEYLEHYSKFSEPNAWKPTPPTTEFQKGTVVTALRVLGMSDMEKDILEFYTSNKASVWVNLQGPGTVIELKHGRIASTFFELGRAMFRLVDLLDAEDYRSGETLLWGPSLILSKLDEIEVDKAVHQFFTNGLEAARSQSLGRVTLGTFAFLLNYYLSDYGLEEDDWITVLTPLLPAPGSNDYQKRSKELIVRLESLNQTRSLKGRDALNAEVERMRRDIEYLGSEGLKMSDFTW